MSNLTLEHDINHFGTFGSPKIAKRVYIGIMGTWERHWEHGWERCWERDWDWDCMFGDTDWFRDCRHDNLCTWCVMDTGIMNSGMGYIHAYIQLTSCSK